MIAVSAGMPVNPLVPPILGEDKVTQRGCAPLHALYLSLPVILAKAGIQRVHQVAVLSGPREVQESISCRGLGGVPQFLFFFPHEWGT